MKQLQLSPLPSFHVIPRGECGECADFLIQTQLTDMPLWEKFADQFRTMPDGADAGWRGEFWGKMMRGAAMIYATLQRDGLYNAMRASVLDMLTVADGEGRVSSYSPETEFDAWDLWCRKYVLLGMLYFLEICPEEELSARVLAYCQGCADAVLRGIGREEGKKPITRASRSWYGVNSSSILEPMVKLYRKTGEKRYLDFASYIVEEGGAEGVPIFDLALENRLLPYQYGVSKAYEMISCFEGLLEYARETGQEKYFTAVENFGRALLSSEVSIIGSLGITHELLDHTRRRQTVRSGDVMQETCVTVTWIKFCARLYELTGDTAFADAIETSFHNAYLGALNVEHRNSPYIREKYIGREGEPYVQDSYLAFDSYSPLTPGVRGAKVGGNRLFADKSYYGCCACIGAAGLGTYLSSMLLEKDGGYVLSFYESGVLTATDFRAEISTAYPRSGRVRVRLVSLSKKSRPVFFRIPAWSKDTRVITELDRRPVGNFLRVELPPCAEAEVVIELDLSLRCEAPVSWDTDTVYTDMSGSGNGWHSAKATAVTHLPEEDNYVAVLSGPLVLGADERFGKSPSTAFRLPMKEDRPKGKESPSPIPTRVCYAFGEGENAFLLGDYASLGLDWKSQITAWLPTEDLK